ncbi:MAG TPA: Gfo/Idh/MocA family oxidoreductase [Gaiellaceae bacterium]|jgi:predicted dehydrogenase
MIQVGVGAWGGSWASEVTASPHWDLVAIADLDETRLAAVADKVGLDAGRRFPSLSAALGDVEAEAVLIAAPPQAHAPLALEALEAGVHCLVEKPLAPSVGEAYELVKRAEESAHELMASQNYRFGRGYRTVQGLVRDGAIGRVEAIEVDFRRSPLFRGFRLEMEEPLLVDMAVHHLDQARGLLAGEAAEVRALSFNPSWSPFAGNAAAFVQVVAGEGAVVSYAGTWVGQGPETTWDGDWFLQGENGALRWSGDEVRIFAKGEEPPGRIGRRLGRRQGRRHQLVDLAETGRAGVLAEFAAAIRANREPETSGQDNLKTLELVFGAVEAAETGLPVRLDRSQP